MNFVASNLFGKNMEGLLKKRADDESNIDFGEIEVLKLEADNAETNENWTLNSL